MRAVVFINYSIAPFNVGHVGWGFEAQPGHFCYGAKEALGMQEVALPGYPNGVFVAHGSETASFITITGTLRWPVSMLMQPPSWPGSVPIGATPWWATIAWMTSTESSRPMPMATAISCRGRGRTGARWIFSGRYLRPSSTFRAKMVGYAGPRAGTANTDREIGGGAV